MRLVVVAYYISLKVGGGRQLEWLLASFNLYASIA